MVNNSTDINKTSNHISPQVWSTIPQISTKQAITSHLKCGQQFHRYQQNKLSHLTSSVVNNSTDINKTSYHILPQVWSTIPQISTKQAITSHLKCGQQFHRYQQNKLSHLTSSVVNNSTDINKTSHHISPQVWSTIPQISTKQAITSHLKCGQQFHRYQQNKPSHLTSSVVNNSTDINKTSYHISPQVWSTIPQISTKQAITSHLKCGQQFHRYQQNKLSHLTSSVVNNSTDINKTSYHISPQVWSTIPQISTKQAITSHLKCGQQFHRYQQNKPSHLTSSVVNNSTDINKTSHHISPQVWSTIPQISTKQAITSHLKCGQQFHRYQQNKPSHLTSSVVNNSTDINKTSHHISPQVWSTIPQISTKQAITSHLKCGQQFHRYQQNKPSHLTSSVVNNSTDINKTSHHISPQVWSTIPQISTKQAITSHLKCGQQFHRYQQNKPSHLTSSVVNNSTDINKTSYHISPQVWSTIPQISTKQAITSHLKCGQQFHRYQQNKLSHLTSSVVNNSTDINKTSYHISPQVWSTIPQISTKQAITSHLKCGQQFHRYQQNKLSHLTSSVVNNSTDINKTSYHISPQVWSTIPQISTKQAITSHLKCGQQFHRYQQNKLSHLTSSHWTWKRSRHMTLEINV